MPRQFDPSKGIKILALVLGSPSAGERASARHMLTRSLSAHRVNGRDLLPRYFLVQLDADQLNRVNDLLCPLWLDDNDNSREQRRQIIERRLIRWRLGWSDLIISTLPGGRGDGITRCGPALFCFDGLS